MPNKQMDPKALAAAKARMAERDKEYADPAHRAGRLAKLNAQADKEGRGAPAKAAAKPKPTPKPAEKPAEKAVARAAPHRPVTKDDAPKRKPAGPTKVTYGDMNPRRR